MFTLPLAKWAPRPSPGLRPKRCQCQCNCHLGHWDDRAYEHFYGKELSIVTCRRDDFTAIRLIEDEALTHALFILG